MANTEVLDFNIDMGPDGAWEPRDYLNSDDELIAWQAANVRDGTSDGHELYHADSEGNIYRAEIGDTDNTEPISYRFATKKFNLGFVACIHSVYLRLAPVSDVLTVTVRAGGSEYKDQEQSYTVRVEATDDDREFKIRCHRTILGHWCQVEITGSVSHRPEVREIEIRYLPQRTGRVTA